MADKPQTVREFLLDEAKKWTVRTGILGVAAAGVWLFTPYREQITAIWHTPERLAQIEATLDRLAHDVRRVSGEDRVIYEQPGQAYVTEPVHTGEPVTLNLVMRRTTTGAACALTGWTPLFADTTNIDQPGTAIGGMHRIGTDMTRLRVVSQPPETIRPGRVTVRLHLEYDCDGARVFDSTGAVPFILLEK